MVDGLLADIGIVVVVLPIRSSPLGDKSPCTFKGSLLANNVRR